MNRRIVDEDLEEVGTGELEQPKFKFGDALQVKGRPGLRFSVRAIELDDQTGTYLYQGSSGTIHWEPELELFKPGRGA
jgi:hypothetical protein